MNVAFFVFNRPALTGQVFAAIRQARPERLLLVADGPRAGHPTDVERCSEVRKIISQVDWPCEVLKNVAECNLGCRKRVATGLDWVFDNVDEAIILEDDCLPAPDFFTFVQAMLERYRDDTRIMHVGGSSFVEVSASYKASYLFSSSIYIWGWGTWRRAWRHYDEALESWPEFRDQGWLEKLGIPRRERLNFQAALNAVSKGELDTWDAQWWFACWSQSGLAIQPAANLVSNIGFGADATHTHSATPKANAPWKNLGPITHPPFVVRDAPMDRTLARMYTGGFINAILPDSWPSPMELIHGIIRRCRYPFSR